MRIPIREQLALLVLFCCLTALAVLAIATVSLWRIHESGRAMNNISPSGFKTINSSSTYGMPKNSSTQDVTLGLTRTLRLSNLALTASLKAAQMAANLLLFQTTIQAMSTRILIQSALQRYNNGNATAVNTALVIVCCPNSD